MKSRAKLDSEYSVYSLETWMVKLLSKEAFGRESYSWILEKEGMTGRCYKQRLWGEVAVDVERVWKLEIIDARDYW